MNEFQIMANQYLRRKARAFYHVPYVRMGNPGNPDYLNVLKNTFNTAAPQELDSAVQELQAVLLSDLPQVLQLSGFKKMTVCVIPRAKAETAYGANQLRFRSTVQASIGKGLEDGTECIRRHSNTRTTHLRNPVRNFVNDGPMPFPGITAQTCTISGVRGKDILLVDDIYTPGVNIDEDAIQALLTAGANTVIFYAIGRT